ncbi:MAG: DNA methyltransferase [Elusimicrobiota bacterium]
MTYFSGHWNITGTRQSDHVAMFPDEIPRRLIRMYFFVGETVLDPFLGSGTTCKVATELGRESIGYEINGEFKRMVLKKIGTVNIEVKVCERSV